MNCMNIRRMEHSGSVVQPLILELDSNIVITRVTPKWHPDVAVALKAVMPELMWYSGVGIDNLGTADRMLVVKTNVLYECTESTCPCERTCIAKIGSTQFLTDVELLRAHELGILKVSR